MPLTDIGDGCRGQYDPAVEGLCLDIRATVGAHSLPYCADRDANRAIPRGDIAA